MWYIIVAGVGYLVYNAINNNVRSALPTFFLGMNFAELGGKTVGIFVACCIVLWLIYTLDL